MNPDEARLRLRSRSVAWRVTGAQVVAVDLERSEYLLVNRSGAELWRLLATGASVGELRDLLVVRYGVGVATAEADVKRFVASLDARRLLESV
ncbi:MAG TPA: PqqD family protein [Acidimicrobiales bacterium]